MAIDDFFRARLDQMIDLRHPLAVLAGRIPWSQIEAALAPVFERKNRQGQVVEINDLFGTTQVIAGAGVSAAGRPRLPIRLMSSLLYLKHAFNLSDEELVARWSENVVWQYFSVKEPMLRTSTVLASKGHITMSHNQVLACLMKPNFVKALIQRGALRWTESDS